MTKLKERIFSWLRLMSFRLLRKSFIFKYWYRRHLTELIYDLEIFDLQKNEISKKYKDKLLRFK